MAGTESGILIAWEIPKPNTDKLELQKTAI